MIFKIEPYDERKKAIWDNFVQGSKNATFLFYRDYMDYHKDRFNDHSLMIYDGQGKLLSLLPANRNDDTLVSHGGLTYGGFLSNERMRAEIMLNIFENVLIYFRKEGFTKWIYKVIPHIYHSYPAEEDGYALFRFNGMLYRRDASTTVIPQVEMPFQERRIRAIKKAKKEGIVCRESEEIEKYWQVLEENLASTYNAQPVHNLSEIIRLKNIFPNNIKLYCAYEHSEVIAGTLIYESNNVARTQYIASNKRAHSIGALDLLFSELIQSVYKGKKYFDFGTSNAEEGRYLHNGLIEFKQGFGGRTTTHDFYFINICK